VTAHTVPGIDGRVMNLSLSGALIRANCDFRLNSLIEIRIQLPDPSECQVLLRAYVARKRGGDVGIEWCESGFDHPRLRPKALGPGRSMRAIQP
jgi:hypothetical protein